MILPACPETPRVTVIDEPEYIVSFHTVEPEPGKVMTFVHLDVFYMGPAVWKRLQSQWALWWKYYPGVLYAMSNIDDDKWVRFISHFGFEYLSDVGCTDGKTRRLFVNFGPKTERPTIKD